MLAVAAAASCWAILLTIWDEIAPLSADSEAIVQVGLTGVVAVVAGLCVYLLSLENQRGWRPNGIGKDDRPMVVTLIVVGVGVLGLFSQLDDLRVFPWLAVVVVAVVLGLALLYRNMKNAPRRRRKAVLWIVFVVYLAAGTAVAVVRTGAAPKLEPIGVLLKGPVEEIAGFYVGESDGEIHIAQLAKGSANAAVSAEPVEAVVGVSRERVTRKAMRAPAGLDEQGSGRQQAERLLRDLIAARDGLSGKELETTPVPTQAPEKSFAPRLSLHSAEPIAPTSADEFLRNSQLHWAFHDCAPKHKRISDKLTTTRQWRDLGKGDFRQKAGCGNDDEYSTSDFTLPYDKKRTFAGRAALAGSSIRTARRRARWVRPCGSATRVTGSD